MTTDLRTQVVEAMAQASYGCDGWDDLHLDDKQIWRDGAKAALDAALDVLESSPSDDDWKLLTDALLAELRDSGKGDS